MFLKGKSNILSLEGLKFICKSLEDEARSRMVWLEDRDEFLMFREATWS